MPSTLLEGKLIARALSRAACRLYSTDEQPFVRIREGQEIPVLEVSSPLARSRNLIYI